MLGGFVENWERVEESDTVFRESVGIFRHERAMQACGHEDPERRREQCDGEKVRAHGEGDLGDLEILVDVWRTPRAAGKDWAMSVSERDRVTTTLGASDGRGTVAGGARTRTPRQR